MEYQCKPNVIQFQLTSRWWTATPKSIFAATKLYTHSVLDMCWTHDGYTLISCSFDGSVKIFQFDVEDLGVASDQSVLVSNLSSNNHT